jgi:hypothetical protein
LIECLATGLVYSNPKPYLRSRHAFHPSLVRLDDGELLCSFDIGEAVEAVNYRTYVSRSRDGGETWTLQGPLFAETMSRPTTSSVRIRRLADGSLVGFGARFYRDDPEEGLQNRATLGMVPMDVILLRSTDGGRSWSGPEVVTPPLVGPSFEVCHAIVELPDGRWLAPTATWRGWDGEAPSGIKAVALISHDRGRTWPEYGVTFDGGEAGIIHWEQSVVPLGGDRLLAVAWAHDPETGRNLPTPYTISHDGGRTFAPPRPTGLHGQTCKALRLDDGRILCVYRRDDRPGLWANLAHLDGEEWLNEAELPLWGTGLSTSGMTGEVGSADELSRLKFGYPSLLAMPGGEVLVAFWCTEECVTGIRWFRLRVAGQ